jgi:hypothetical protein
MGEFIETSLIICIVLLNYFFFRMWHLLHGKWWRMSPTWKWAKDIAQLKNLAKAADIEKLRQECNFVIWGLYFTAGYLLLVVIIDFALPRMGYYN